jgi:hypothetical protein
LSLRWCPLRKLRPGIVASDFGEFSATGKRNYAMHYPYIHQPSISWGHTPLWVRATCLELSDRCGLGVDEVVKAVRAQMISDMSDDDDWDARVFAGDFRSFGGMVLNYALDITAAKHLAAIDIELQTRMLNGNPGLMEIVAVHENTTAWLRFWAARSPAVDRRPEFAQHAEEGEARLNAMLGRPSAPEHRYATEDVIDVIAWKRH